MMTSHVEFSSEELKKILFDEARKRGMNMPSGFYAVVVRQVGDGDNFKVILARTAY